MAEMDSKIDREKDVKSRMTTERGLRDKVKREREEREAQTRSAIDERDAREQARQEVRFRHVAH